MVAGPHAAHLASQGHLSVLQLASHRSGLHRPGFAGHPPCPLHSLGKRLHHQLHAHVDVIVLGLGKALAEGLVERFAVGGGHIGQPVGHRHHLADARVPNGGGCTQGVAVESVELAIEAGVLRCLHQQGQVIAPVAGDDGLRAAGLDLVGVGQKVLYPAHRMQLFSHHLHVGALGGQLLAGLAQHGLAEAVVLPDEVDLLQALVGLDGLHQRGHAHVGMGVEAEVPEAALLVGQGRVHRRIVQEQHPPRRVAFVVFADRIQQGRSGSRRIALQDELRPVVDGGTQGRQCLFVLALAVVARHGQQALAVGQAHTAPGIHPLGGPDQVAKDGLTGVGERPAQAFHHGEADGRQTSAAGLGMNQASAKK